MKRTKLKDRLLPDYTHGEEVMNMVTHIVGGGIAYTVGAILFGLGKRLRWMHSVFHIFVVLGSMLQLITVLFYVL